MDLKSNETQPTPNSTGSLEDAAAPCMRVGLLTKELREKERSVPRRAPTLAQEMHNEDAFEVERE